MLTIIHGDNHVASRQQLTELTTQAQNRGMELLSLEAEQLDRASLEAQLGSSSLFGQDKIVVIEAVHSLPKSAKKDQLIKLINDASIDIILWEKKSLGKLELKKLPSNAAIFEHKSSKQLWNLLDSLRGQRMDKTATLRLLRESCASENAEFVLVMLARQLRLLIQVKDAGAPKLAPFMLSKLKRQADSFSLSQLLQLHRQLYQLDLRLKQSRNQLPLAAELDLWLINM